MNWPSSVRRGAQGVPVHLEHFADQLRELAQEVKASLAGLAGEAVGRAVRDVLTRFWRQSPRQSYRERHAYGRQREEWEDDDPYDEEAPSPSPPVSHSSPRLALAFQVAGWLLQNRSWIGLLGVGLGVGGIVYFSGHITVAGFNIINGVADLTALLMLLNSGDKLLDSF